MEKPIASSPIPRKRFTPSGRPPGRVFGQWSLLAPPGLALILLAAAPSSVLAAESDGVASWLSGGTLLLLVVLVLCCALPMMMMGRMGSGNDNPTSQRNDHGSSVDQSRRPT